MKRVFMLILMIQFSALFPQHSDEIIEEKLELILQEIDGDNRELGDLPPFFEKLIEILINMNIFFKIIMILLLAAFIIYTLSKVSRIFIKDKSYRSSSGETQRDNIKRSIPPMDYLKNAAERALKKEYSLAIIALHRGSVHNLFDKDVLTSGRDYTNREIREIISDCDTSGAFYNLALNAELITFKGKRCVEDEYKEMEQLYRRYFL